MQDAVVNKQIRRRLRNSSRRLRNRRRHLQRKEKFDLKSILSELEPELFTLSQGNPFHILDDSSPSSHDDGEDRLSGQQVDPVESASNQPAPISSACPELGVWKPFQWWDSTSLQTIFHAGPSRHGQANLDETLQSMAKEETQPFPPSLQRQVDSSLPENRSVSLKVLPRAVLNDLYSESAAIPPTKFAGRTYLQPSSPARALDKILYRKHSRFFPRQTNCSTAIVRPETRSRATSARERQQTEDLDSRTATSPWSYDLRMLEQEMDMIIRGLDAMASQGNATNLWRILSSPQGQNHYALPLHGEHSERNRDGRRDLLNQATGVITPDAPSELDSTELARGANTVPLELTSQAEPKVLRTEDEKHLIMPATCQVSALPDAASAGTLNEMMMYEELDPLLSASALLYLAVGTTLPVSRPLTPFQDNSGACNDDVPSRARLEPAANDTCDTCASQQELSEPLSVQRRGSASDCWRDEQDDPTLGKTDWDVVTCWDETDKAFLNWDETESNDEEVEIVQDDWFFCTADDDEDGCRLS